MKTLLIIGVVAAISISSFAAEAKKPAPPAVPAEEVAAPTKAVIDLTKENFETVINSDKVVLVDFWATWCPPCRTQGPILDEVAKEVANNVVIAKVNVDESQALASQFQIQSIPTLIIFKDGKPVERLQGVHQKDMLLGILKDK